MPSITEIRYSREATVAAVRDYYRFLVSMYLDESDVLEPPEGGWPSIPHKGWLNFEKTDEVIALLRELPYLNTRCGPNEIHGAPYTTFADWQSIPPIMDGPDLKKWSEPYPDDANVPAHIVGLTVPSDQSLAMLLDTELGVIYWHECRGEVRLEGLAEVDTDPYDWMDRGLISEEQAEWRANGGVWSIETFFEMLKDHFRRLNFVPVRSGEVHDVWVARHEYFSEMRIAAQNIYRKHGWPDMARFNKKACCDELNTWVKEHAANWHAKAKE